MCKLSVSMVNKGPFRVGDVISQREDHEHEGEIPRQNSNIRIVRVPGVMTFHPSIQKLFLMDRLPGKDMPKRRFYLDLTYLGNLALRSTPGWTGASDQAIVTNLLALETATKIRFIPITSVVVR
jgi:hypothetical protein